MFKFALRKKRRNRHRGDNEDANHDEPRQQTVSPPIPAGKDDPQLGEPSLGTNWRYNKESSESNAIIKSDGTARALSGTESSGKDPLGLKVIHRPSGEPRVDIVLIHGLGGSSRMTWSYNRDPEFFWPLKFLASEHYMDEARILTFGYNANFLPRGGKNKVSILDFAKDLLYDLKFAKDDSASGLEDLKMGKRPIIFVVHSMGGLVVKEAYLLGQSDPMYESIIKAVFSIIFLSTPHRGTNLAETLNRILQISFIGSPKPFIAELATGSQTLQRLNEQFRHVAPKMRIFSFYETRPTAILKKTQLMVLEKDSSVLGYPGEVSKPLDADHHGVCKYSSPKDPGYIAVRNVLKSLIGEAKPKASTLPGEQPPPLANFEDYLSVSESPDVDYNFFRDRWTTGTCSWILSDEVFSTWLQDTRTLPRVLWINGDAASGKSILSSFVINHVVQIGLPCQYFFVRFMSQGKRSLGTMLRSLACQLAKSIPGYASKLHELQAAATNLKTADYRTIWLRLFKQSLFHLGLDFPIYWIIDGVDEAEQPQSIIELLSDLDSTSMPLRILIVSRKTHDISSALRKIAKYIRMDSIYVEGNPADIRSYIDREMDLAGDNSYQEEITEHLLDRAKGNFLWVHLAVQRINTCHTERDVEEVMENLPSRMEVLYDRMASSIQSHPTLSHRKLGLDILGWATCARRLLSLDELSDALGNSGVLDFHRTIGDLCGGFVTVDHDGKVAMMHETTREYLTRARENGQPVLVDEKSTNDMLLKRCVARLTDPKMRLDTILAHHPPPALLEYAMNSWAHHLAHSTIDQQVLSVVVNFLKSIHVLNWIYAAAMRQELRTLVATSRCLTDVSLKLRRSSGDDQAQCEAALIIDGWATDLIKIVGKFGKNLSRYPRSIYQLIPPFCPEKSSMYQQFGKRRGQLLQVSGLTGTIWDDCLARFYPSQGFVTSAVVAAGSRIAVLTALRKTSQVIIYNPVTFEEQLLITHDERVSSIQLNKLGELLVSYGYFTTRVWDLSSGACIKAIKNPQRRPFPHSMLFRTGENGSDTVLMVCGEDRRIRTFDVNDETAEDWEVFSQVDELSLDKAFVSFPVCSALSPDGNMIAFGYRTHPVTVWDLQSSMSTGQCIFPLDATDMTVETSTYGEVFKLAWHPFSGEVFGLTQVGFLFRWDPSLQDEVAGSVQTGAYCFVINSDGSLVATGDAFGTITIYATADFAILYRLASQDPVLHLAFSTDSRCLYDIRGSHGNVWEPNILVRLADFSDHNNDDSLATERLSRASLHAEYHSARVDNVTALAGQPLGLLYCYGTEDGVAILGEARRGKICELKQSNTPMSIEQLAWSPDGCLVALLDLRGRLIVKRISVSTISPDSWDAVLELDTIISKERGNPGQIIFDPTSHKILVTTPSTLFLVDIGTELVTESSLDASKMPAVKWVSHPTCADALLGFGNTEVHVFSWADLQESNVYTYCSPGVLKTTMVSQPSTSYGDGTGGFQRGAEIPERLISGHDSSQVLLEVSLPSTISRRESQYLLFDVDEIRLSEGALESEQGNGNELRYTHIPPNVAARIREPLAVLSRNRLAFLDVDQWVCTWRPSSTRPARPQPGIRAASGLESTTTATMEIEQYYFLPDDWVTSDDTRLCTLTPDCVFLCPHNGDVAAIRIAKLRRT